MGIYKRGKIWWFKKVYQGNKVEESLGTPNKALAERIYAKKLTEIIEGTYFDIPQEITMNELIEKYINETSCLLRATTHERHKQMAKQLKKFMGNQLLINVTPSFLSTYKSKRLKEVAPQTVKKELALLRRVFNVAIDEWEYCDKNPVPKVMKSLPGDNKRVRFLSPEEFQKLRFTLPRWLTPIAFVASQTGLRRSNLVLLTKDQLDFNSNLIVIPETKNEDPVAVPMTSMVKKILRELLSERKVVSPYVFCDERGNPYSLPKVSMAFKRACDRAGIENLRYHDLRHHFASSLVQNGVDLYPVQKLMGHKDQRMTQRYAHLAPKNLRDAVKALENSESATILRQSEKKRGHGNA